MVSNFFMVVSIVSNEMWRNLIELVLSVLRMYRIPHWLVLEVIQTRCPWQSLMMKWSSGKSDILIGLVADFWPDSNLSTFPTFSMICESVLLPNRGLPAMATYLSSSFRKSFNSVPKSKRSFDTCRWLVGSTSGTICSIPTRTSFPTSSPTTFPFWMILSSGWEFLIAKWLNSCVLLDSDCETRTRMIAEKRRVMDLIQVIFRVLKFLIFKFWLFRVLTFWSTFEGF